MNDGDPARGEPLPRAAEAFGVRDKLARYSLDMTHKDGAPKAHGFARILGVRIADIGYLQGAIQTGILILPVNSMRDNSPWGINRVVMVPVRGLGERSERVANVRTVWESVGDDSPPRLVNAYVKT